MNGRPTSVLLAGDLGTASAMLRKWFTRRRCECQFAASFEDVCRRLSQAEFDLVLCPYDLPDRTAFPLFDWLEGTRSTLLFYASSGRDSRWLPVIERGERCLDWPLLRTPDLPKALAYILDGDSMGSSVKELKEIPLSIGQVRAIAKASRLSRAVNKNHTGQPCDG